MGKKHKKTAEKSGLRLVRIVFANFALLSILIIGIAKIGVAETGVGGRIEVLSASIGDLPEGRIIAQTVTSAGARIILIEDPGSNAGNPWIWFVWIIPDG